MAVALAEESATGAYRCMVDLAAATPEEGSVLPLQTTNGSSHYQTAAVVLGRVRKLVQRAGAAAGGLARTPAPAAPNGPSSVHDAPPAATDSSVNDPATVLRVASS